MLLETVSGCPGDASGYPDSAEEQQCATGHPDDGLVVEQGVSRENDTDCKQESRQLWESF